MINSLFFYPCGWYKHYHFGVWKALKEYNILNNIKSIGGSSSGSIATILLAKDGDEEKYSEQIKNIINKYPNTMSFGKMTNIIEKIIDNNFSENFNWKFNPYITITTINNSGKFINSNFIKINTNNVKEIKETILASYYIPLLHEDTPKWNDKIVIDSSVSVLNMLTPNTLISSPFKKMNENTIGPENYINNSLINIDLIKSLKPDPNNLENIKQFGYNNAKKWIEKYQ